MTDALRRGSAQRMLLSDGGDAADPDRASRKTRALSAAANLTEDLHRLVGRGDGEVAWVDGTRRSVRLRLSPIDVGPALAGMLWGGVTAVLTSATIPPRVIERVGLEGFPTEELNVGSPFDSGPTRCSTSHAICPTGTRQGPRRRCTRSWPSCSRRPAAAPSRSSRAGAPTEAAADALGPELPYTLLRQGDLPKGRLLEEFARDETSCLFATLGFWQGVDIPGRALSLVTIDRLPFPRTRRPVAPGAPRPCRWARLHLVDLPRAATLLAQGAGG